MTKSIFPVAIAIFATLTCSIGCIDLSSENGRGEVEPSLPGGYSAISTIEAMPVAEFAVTEQSKNGPALTLSSIESAKTQVVAGTNVQLELTVLDGGVKKSAQAIVYTDLSQKRSLSSWAWK